MPCPTLDIHVRSPGLFSTESNARQCEKKRSLCMRVVCDLFSIRLL